jgi:hypothetical protein
MTKRPENDPTPVLILFGLDPETTKPRAAYFEPQTADLALEAAKLMQLSKVSVTTDEARALALKLPAGKVYASGRGFVPFVRRDLYDAVLALAAAAPDQGGGQNQQGTADQPATSVEQTSAPASTAPAPRLPAGWDQIGHGSLVLATLSLDDGWWEAVVERVEGPVLTLKWRDYPSEPRITRRIEQLALLHPGT